MILNSNWLQVLVKEPLPAEAKKSGDSFEDTMLLLDIVREKKKKQNENRKVFLVLFSLFSFLAVTYVLMDIKAISRSKYS